MLSLGTPELSLFLIGPTLGPTELILILVIVVIFFGVGRLPEVFGGLGKGIREFRRAAKDGEEEGRAQSRQMQPPLRRALSLQWLRRQIHRKKHDSGCADNAAFPVFATPSCI